jgi:ubiquinone/menaquinone biosynthesis C-methylase UbiE
VTRGQRVYDWWSRHGRLLRGLYDVVFLGKQARLRTEAVDALALSPGDSVLDVGCGDGINFPRLRADVGSSGQVVGVDYSAGMVSQARERARGADWENVHVLHGDAQHLGIRPDAFDAVLSTMAVSAMPRPEQVAREVARTLRPGGRIALLDARPFPRLPWSLANPLVELLSAWATDWNPEGDVVGALEAVFEEVVLSEYVDGAVFVAVGQSER